MLKLNYRIQNVIEIEIEEIIWKRTHMTIIVINKRGSNEAMKRVPWNKVKWRSMFKFYVLDLKTNIK